MSQFVTAALLDRPETAQLVSRESCPACEFVHRFGSGAGVYFVVVHEALYRTEQLDNDGQVMLCVQTSAAEAWRELERR